MTKTEFYKKLRPTLNKYKVWFDYSHRQLEPNIPDELTCPEIEFIWTPLPNVSLYTKKNLQHLIEHIPLGKPYYEKWKKRQAEYRKTEKYKLAKHRLNFHELALEAGLNHDEHGSYGYRRDVQIIDFVWKKKDLRNYFACGKYLGLVNQHASTRYKGKYSGYTSHSNNYFVVGTNENGVPFCHQVSNQIHESLDAAINWIWQGNKVEARQGDVAITKSHLKQAAGGGKKEVTIVDSHRAKGTIYEERGQLHIQCGVIYHEKGQHPPIEVGKEWKRIIIGRRSERGMSSAD